MIQNLNGDKVTIKNDMRELSGDEWKKNENAVKKEQEVSVSNIQEETFFSFCMMVWYSILWIKKMWYIYTMESYSAFKKNEIMPFAAIWVDLEIIILSEESQTKINTIWYHLYVESKIWHKWTYLWKRNRLTDIEETCDCQGVGREGRIESLGLVDVNYYT